LVKDSREIKRQGRTLIDGPHLLECYRRRIGSPALIVVSESGSGKPEIAGLLADCPGAEVMTVADGLFRDLSGVATPVGILGVIDVPPTPDDDIRGRCVMLDAVQRATEFDAERVVEALVQLYVDDVPKGTRERRRAERLYQRFLEGRAYRRLANGRLDKAREDFGPDAGGAHGGV
jgi:hypothetical protein